MIVKISRGSNIAAIIGYHEKKVNEGEAEIISNNTLEDSKEGKINCFKENFELNPKVQKNKFAHFSFALSPEENLNSDKFKEVAREYLTKMGYSDTPEVMYRHFDGATEHIHVVCSSIKYSGEKISEFKDFVRGKEICRELEKTHGLEIVQDGENKKSLQLQEINADKYSLFNGIKKAALTSPTIPFFGKMPEKFSNEEFQKRYGNKEFEKIYSELDLKGFIYKTDKTHLEEKLNYLYTTSNNKSDFLNKLTDNQIYYRELIVKNTPTINYGYNGKYFSEKQVPSKFSLNNLNTSYGKKEQLNTLEQKLKIKAEIARALIRSKGYEDFIINLNFKGIEVKEAKNARGIYGLSFKLEGNESIVFKGSELDRKFSYENIIKKVDNNLVKAISKSGKNQSFEKSNKPGQATTPSKAIKSPFNSPTDDPEELKRKRKQQADNKDTEQDM